MPRYLKEPPYTHGNAPKCGVLLINLGTPDAPTAPAVRRYLREFLADPRVVEVPRAAWWLILNLFILRFAQAIRPGRCHVGSPMAASAHAPEPQSRCSRYLARASKRRCALTMPCLRHPSFRGVTKLTAGLRPPPVLPLSPNFGEHHRAGAGRVTPLLAHSQPSRSAHLRNFQRAIPSHRGAGAERQRLLV